MMGNGAKEFGAATASSHILTALGTKAGGMGISGTAKAL